MFLLRPLNLQRQETQKNQQNISRNGHKTKVVLHETLVIVLLNFSSKGHPSGKRIVNTKNRSLGNGVRKNAVRD